MVVVTHSKKISQRKAFAVAARNPAIAIEDSAKGNVLNLNACTHAFVFIPIIFRGEYNGFVTSTAEGAEKRSVNAGLGFRFEIIHPT